MFQEFLLYWDMLHRNEVVGKRFPLYIESHTENKRSEFKEAFHSELRLKGPDLSAKLRCLHQG